MASEEQLKRNLRDAADEYLAFAAAKVAEEDEQRQIEEYKRSPDYEPMSEERAAEVRARLMVRLAAMEHKEKVRHRKIRFRAFLVAAAVVCLLFSLAVVAAREGVFDFLTEDQTQYTEIHGDGTKVLGKPKGWDSEYYPTWLPEGMELKETIKVNGNLALWYEDGDRTLSFSLYEKSTTPFVDTEGMKSEKIVIDGKELTIYVDETHLKSASVQKMSDAYIVISGQINMDEIKKLIENIHTKS